MSSPTLPPFPSTIANLPPATTPLSGSEFIPATQNGKTVRITAGSIAAVGGSPLFVSVLAYPGADPTGVTSSASAIAAANTAAAAIGGVMVFPPGTYLVSTNTVITVPVFFSGGIIKPANGVTVTLPGLLEPPVEQLFNISLGGTISFSGHIAFVYCEWWGAKFDGSTNDTNAVQAAITAVQVYKGTILFSAGSYPALVSGVTIGVANTDQTCHFESLSIDPSNAANTNGGNTSRYVGQGGLKLISGSNANLITVVVGAAPPIFRRVTLNGNGSGQSSGTSYCIYFTATSALAYYTYGGWFDECVITGGYTGGVYVGSNRGAGMMRGCLVQYCGTTTAQSAINLNCYDWLFEATNIGPNNGYGVNMQSVTQIQMTDCALFQNNINLNIDNGCGAISINNTVIDSATQHGVTIAGGTQTYAYGGRSFTNCEFRRNGQGATNTYSDLYVNGDQRLSLNGCTFTGPESTSSTVEYCINPYDASQSSIIHLSGITAEANTGYVYATAFCADYTKLYHVGIVNDMHVAQPAGTDTMSFVTAAGTENVRWGAGYMTMKNAVYCDPNYTAPAPLTGATITVASGQTGLFVLPAGSLTALTVALPPPTSDGQIFRFSSSQAITTVTFSAQSPATSVFNSTVSSLAAGQAVHFLYVAGGTAWVRA